MSHGGAMKSDDAGALGEETEKIGNIVETDEVFGMCGQQVVFQAVLEFEAFHNRRGRR